MCLDGCIREDKCINRGNRGRGSYKAAFLVDEATNKCSEIGGGYWTDCQQIMWYITGRHRYKNKKEEETHMMTIIIILVILYIIGSTSPDGKNTSYNSNQYTKGRRPSKKDIKRMKKARDRAEMEAFEDMYMFCEAFMDD